MRLLDVNVVVSLHRPEHAHHEASSRWFERLQEANRPFAVPSSVWTSFVRIVTNRRAFEEPTTAVEAFGFVRSMARQARYTPLEPGPRHLELFEHACTEAEATGDLVPDAYLAALAIEHGCTLVSLDRDFARFEGLRWERPG
ncbi:MAG: type II toxin-antitoxin system VapC family toxin [Solirubrobacteraceae bacterium]